MHKDLHRGCIHQTGWYFELNLLVNFLHYVILEPLVDKNVTSVVLKHIILYIVVIRKDL